MTDPATRDKYVAMANNVLPPAASTVQLVEAAQAFMDYAGQSREHAEALDTARNRTRLPHSTATTLIEEANTLYAFTRPQVPDTSNEFKSQ